MGCATFLAPEASVEEQSAYAAAKRELERDPAAGREALDRFLARYPDSPLAPEAGLALGELARSEGRLDDAGKRYEEVVHGGGTAADRARVQLAAIELQRGDVNAARGWIERARLSRLEGADLREAYRVSAETATSSAERVRWLGLLRSEVPDPAETAAIDLQIDAMLNEMPVSELQSAARQVGDRPPAGRIQLALAARALAEGDLDVARKALEEARRQPLAPRYAPQLAAVESRFNARSAGPTDVAELPTFEQEMQRPYPETARARGTLGVVLPLTGPYAGFGEESLEGALLAAGTFPEPDGSPRPKMRVLVRDSGGDPAQTARAIRELAADPDVVAIIGPLVSAECEAAAEEAQALGVPLLALSAREEVAHDRDWVFRVGTRPVEEAQLVAERALALGAERFGILYPADPYGQGLSSLFWAAVEARGGHVVAVASFDPKATDFGDSIRRLVGYDLIDGEEKQLIARREAMLERARRLPNADARALRAQARSLTTADGRPIPPIVDFDALFIPATVENVVLIAPQLAFHEVTGPRLLGTEGWYGSELARLGGKHVEGALFAAHFYPDSPVPYVSAFRSRFTGVFGADPDAFAAQGFDAASLVLVQLARGRDERSQVRDGLLATEAFPGVSGVLTMRSDGNANKRPYLLGIEDGQIHQYVD